MQSITWHIPSGVSVVDGSFVDIAVVVGDLVVVAAVVGALVVSA